MSELVQPKILKKLSRRIGGNPLAQPLIAVREYQLGEGEVFCVAFHRPLLLRKFPPQWVAAFSIEGLGAPYRGSATGADSLHALLLAIELARRQLEAQQVAFSWLDGEIGDTGIPATIPSYYGLEVSRHLESVVYKETKRLFGKRKRSDRR